MSDLITKNAINKQSWKFYFTLILWPVYIFILPLLFARIGYWSVFYMIFPGIFLFTWAGYNLHECWHKYIPGLPNDFLYYVFSLYLLTDPQIYRMIHGHHHAKVNSYDDFEFHPLGEIKNPVLRRIYNFFEITLGIIFIFIIAMIKIGRHPAYKDKFKMRRQLQAFIFMILIYTVIFSADILIFKIKISQILIPFIINHWLGSLMQHHSQLVEHGNLIVNGDYNARNIATRNLSSKGLPEKIFLFLTHWDSNEHVLHHTLPGVYSRPFPGKIDLPENSTIISLKDYMKILKTMIT